MADLTDKVFVVVGASGALGSRIAQRLSDAGASLTLAVRSADSPIDGAHTVSADLREPDAGQRVIDAAMEQHGHIDGAAASALFLAAAKEARKSKIRVLDIRPPHTETGLAGRAIAGDAPKMPDGADPDAVAQRIVEAILGNERELPSSAFG